MCEGRTQTRHAARREAGAAFLKRTRQARAAEERERASAAHDTRGLGRSLLVVRRKNWGLHCIWCV